MTTTQLPRQLELTLNALSRAFRQAHRHAVKTDPQGHEETGLAWKTVAARQAQLLTMLAAVAPFLVQTSPPFPLPEPLLEASNAVVPKPPVAAAADVEADDDEVEDLSELPSDLLDVYRKILAVEKWPTNTQGEKQRQAQELLRLNGIMARRYNQWRAERAASSADAPAATG